MTIIHFFLCLWVFFALLDPDPDPDPATQINPDPQPRPLRDTDTVLVSNTYICFSIVWYRFVIVSTLADILSWRFFF